MGQLRAILWDMDGTLIDSEPLWHLEERRLMNAAGLQWTDADAAACIGRPVTETIAGMRARGLGMGQHEAVETLVEAVAAALGRDLPWRPGARELLTGAHGLRSALVTMSDRRVAEPLLAAAPGVFDAVVTGDAVSRGKPDPEPYLTAMSRLGVRSDECVAFEDSIPGVASARAAGVVTIGIEHAVPLDGSGAHRVLRSLEGFGAGALRGAHAALSVVAER